MARKQTNTVNPTNNDILDAVIALAGEVSSVKEIALATKKQAEKTNGRVTKVEDWKNALIAVEQYKKEQVPVQNVSAPNATTVQVVQPTRWFQNQSLVGGVVAFLLAIAGAIGYFAGGAK